MRSIGLAAAAAYIATIWLANYLVDRYGFVSVGFGLAAPAGVYAAGLALGLRDVVQRTLGLYVVVVAILAGAALSWAVSPRLAAASATAFLASELADLVVYTPLRRRGWVLAVFSSNVVGLVVDSMLFLWLAFGSLAFLKGQIVGKLWATLAGIALIALADRIVRREIA